MAEYDVYIEGRVEPIHVTADQHEYSESMKRRVFLVGGRPIAAFDDNRIEGIVKTSGVSEDDDEAVRRGKAQLGSKMVG